MGDELLDSQLVTNENLIDLGLSQFEDPVPQAEIPRRATPLVRRFQKPPRQMNLEEQRRATAMTLRDMESFSLVGLQAAPRLLSEVGVSDAQRAEWKKKGPIGFWEGMFRSGEDAIPFVPLGGIRAFNLWQATKRLEVDDYRGDERQRLEDVRDLNQYLAQVEEERIRGFSGLGKFGSALIQVPGFMLEFGLSGGIATAGKKGAKLAAQAILKDKLTAIISKKLGKSLLGRGFKRTVLGTAGALARTGTAFLPRALGDASRRQLESHLKLTEKGMKISTEGSETPFTSLAKGLGSAFISAFVEDPTGIVARGLSKVGGQVVGIGRWVAPKKMVDGVTKLHAKIRPGKKLSELQTTVGWNGFWGEVGEERAEAFFQALTGIEDFTQGQSDSIFDNIMASIPDKEGMLLEAGLIMSTGSGLRALQLIRERKTQTGEKEPELQEITDEKMAEVAVVGTPEEVEPEVEGLIVEEPPTAPEKEALPLQTEEEILDILAGRKPVPQGLPLEVFRSIVKDRKIRAAQREKQRVRLAIEDLSDSTIQDIIDGKIEPPEGISVKAIKQLLAERTAEEKAEAEKKAKVTKEEEVVRGRVQRLEEEQDVTLKEDVRLGKEKTKIEEKAEKQTAQVTKDISGLETTLKDQQTELKELTGKKQEAAANKEFQRRAEKVKKETVALEKQVKALEAAPGAAIVKLEKSIARIDGKISTLRSRLEAAKTEKAKDNIRGQITQLESQKKEIGRQIKTATSKQATEIRALNKKISTRKNKLAQINKEKEARAVTQAASTTALRTSITANKTKIENLRKQLKTLDQQRVSQLRAIEKQIDINLEKFDKLGDQISTLLEAEAPEVGKREKITTTGQRLLSVIARKVREGIQFTRKGIQIAQNDLRRIVNESLPLEDRGRLNIDITKIQSAEDLAKFLPGIQAKIDAIVDKNLQIRLKTTIKRQLKSMGLVKGRAKPTGKFLAKWQKVFNKIISASKMTRVQGRSVVSSAYITQQNARAKAEENGEIFEQDENYIQDNSIIVNLSGLNDKGGDAKTSEELSLLANDLQKFLKDAREESKTIQEIEKAKREADIGVMKSSINPGDAPLPTESQRRKNEDSIKRKFLNFINTITGWNEVNSLLDNSKSDFLRVRFEEIHSVTAIEQKEKGDVQRSTQEFMLLAFAEYGVSNEKALMQKFKEDSILKPGDKFTLMDTQGNDVEIHMTRAQMRKVYMESLDPSLIESRQDERGGYLVGTTRVHGWTEAMDQAIFDRLTPEDRAFASAQLGFYKNLYDKINKQYEKDNGAPLPFNPTYSPLRREKEQATAQDLFLGEMSYRMSTDPRFTKTRTKNFNPIVVQSDIEALQRHSIDAHHYLNWSDKLKQLNNIYGNSEIRTLVKAKYGAGTLKVINGYVNAFTGNGTRIAASYDSALNFLRTNFTVSVLALKPAITLKQMVSFIAYGEFVPKGKFIGGVFDFLSDPARAIKILSTSDLLSTRGNNITRDIKDAAQSQDFSFFFKNPSWKNAMLVTTRLGDRGAILLGGWSVYKHNIDQGKTHEQAIAAFEKATSATQQSGDLSQQSEIQRGGSFAKLFTMFTSSQNQYLRREIQAIRDFQKGRLSKPELMKKIAIYHFMLPMFFQLVSDGFDFDEDEQKRAALLGSLNGVFILGDMMDAVIRTGFNAFTDAELDVFQAKGVPVFTSNRGMLSSFKKLGKEEVGVEDVMEAIGDLLGKTVGPLTGLPAQRIIDSLDGVEDILGQGQVLKGAEKLMGWSPRSVEKRFKEEKKKKTKAKGRKKTRRRRAPVFQGF